MFTFLTGFLGGAAFGGTYVLLTTPRSGKDNRRVIKHYAEDVKGQVENVQDKSQNMQGALTNLNVEVSKLKTGVMPDIKGIADDFSAQASVYQRRINEGVEEIQSEIDDMNRRIAKAKGEPIVVDKVENESDDSDK